MFTFPELLKEIRRESNLTQEEMAKILEVSTVLIAMIETGQKEVSKAFIIKLAEKLGVHPSSITPFIFANEKTNKLSGIERNLIIFGEKMQADLIKKKAKKLKKNA